MLRLLVASLMVLVPLAPAAAQQDPLEGFADPLGQLQRMVPRAGEGERADVILGEAAAAMDPAPAALAALEDRRLLVPGDAEWDEAVAWAQGEAQRAALGAFEEATDRRAGMAFALPYGEDAPAELRRAGFWAELEDGKLYRPVYHYSDGLEALATLVWIEANRLAASGEGHDAAELMTGLVRLGRMLVDRPMLEESANGYGLMFWSLEGLRDLAHRNAELLDRRSLRRVVRELEDRTLRLDRMLFPSGRELAVKQAILDSYERMGAADIGAIGSIAGEAGLPADELDHVGYFEAVEVAERVFNDWRLRWPLDPYDVVMQRPSYYSSLVSEPRRYALVLGAAPAHELLFEMRMRLDAELAGTRLGLGVHAYRGEYGRWPKPLVAIRPAFVSEIDVDPYDPNRGDQMPYFVPMRDQEWGPRETPHPHTITVHVGLEGQELTSMASHAILKALPDDRAVSSVRAYVETLTSMRIEPRNIEERTSAGASVSLKQLVPAHLEGYASDLSGEPLREFVRVMIRTTLLAPEYPELRRSFGVDPDDSRRRRRRGSRDEEVPRDLETASRLVALAQLEAGAPLARRLTREQSEDPTVAVFDVTLDESDFVLYSAGYNGVEDWAVESGLDGTDLTYWPPMLSLLREHTGG